MQVILTSKSKRLIQNDEAGLEKFARSGNQAILVENRKREDQVPTLVGEN